MFGRKPPTIVHVEMPTRTEYVTKEVIEKRAPTDQSVALLREMEAAALKKVEHAVNVGGNGFECVVAFEIEAMSSDRVAKAMFTLNGKRMKAEARAEGWRDDGFTTLPDRLRQAVADEIAREMLATAFASARWPNEWK